MSQNSFKKNKKKIKFSFKNVTDFVDAFLNVLSDEIFANQT